MNRNNNSRKLTVVFAAILVLLLILDSTPFGGKNIPLYVKWIECSRRPVQTASKIADTVRWYEEAQLFKWPLSFIGGEYFCTPLEAERAGYSANPEQYQFPHLNKERVEKSQ